MGPGRDVRPKLVPWTEGTFFHPVGGGEGSLPDNSIQHVVPVAVGRHLAGTSEDAKNKLQQKRAEKRNLSLGLPVPCLSAPPPDSLLCRMVNSFAELEGIFYYLPQESIPVLEELCLEIMEREGLWR